MTWAEAVRTTRDELKMTQEDFAHALGVTVSTVNRWESGRFAPSRLARRALVKLRADYGLRYRE